MVRARTSSAAAGTRFTRAVEKRVLAFIRERELVAPGEPLMLAVSGGPDSTAMLAIIARLQEEFGSRLTVAHFDHMLRSREEAAEDEEFVRELGASFRVPVVSGRGDVARRARKERLSVEDAARRMRYGFLAREARKAGAGAVLLGHTLDDRAESVLMHLLRGSGPDGLVGIRPRAPWPFPRGPEAVRPLLEMRRAETVLYCEDLGLDPRYDPTNEVPVPTRNRMRHDLMPLLRGFNPRVEQALARMAESISRDADFIEPAVEEAWQRLADAAADRVSFPRPDLAALPPAIAARLLRRAVARLLGSSADLEAVHVESVLAALGRRRYRASLPHGVEAAVAERSVVLSRGEPEKAPPLPQTELAVPGETRAGPWVFRAEIVPPGPRRMRIERLEAYLDADALAMPLSVRSRRPGDRLRPLGLGGEKKLQDILVDAKVPADQRDGVPIVYDENGPVWVPGHCLDERAALRGTSRRAVHVKAARIS